MAAVGKGKRGSVAVREVPGQNSVFELAAPLPNGSSINLQFLLGIQQTGIFKFYLNVETLP